MSTSQSAAAKRADAEGSTIGGAAYGCPSSAAVCPLLKRGRGIVPGSDADDSGDKVCEAVQTPLLPRATLASQVAAVATLEPVAWLPTCPTRCNCSRTHIGGAASAVEVHPTAHRHQHPPSRAGVIRGSV